MKDDETKDENKKTDKSEDFDDSPENTRLEDKADIDVTKTQVKDATKSRAATAVPDIDLLGADQTGGLRELLRRQEAAIGKPSEKQKASDAGKPSQEKREDFEKLKEFQQAFLSPLASANERRAALDAMESLLQKKDGTEAAELKKGIETNRRLDQLIGLSSDAASFKTENLIAALQTPTRTDAAILGLAVIANGGNGDKSQALSATAALQQFVGKDETFNTARAKQVIDALLASRTAPYSDKFLGLVLASDLAAKSQHFPDALHQSIQEALNSDTAVGREAGFNAIKRLGGKASDADFKALQENMTPELAKNIMALPPDLLARNDYALISEAVTRLPKAELSKFFTDAATQQTTKLTELAKSELADAGEVKTSKGLQQAAVKGLAEIARGRVQDEDEATRAYNALKKLAESPEAKHAVIEAIAKTQPARNSDYWTIPLLGKTIASLKDGYESVGEGLPENEKLALKKAVRDAIETSLKSHAAADNRWAGRSLSWLAKTMDEELLNVFKDNLSFESINELSPHVKAMKPELQALLRQDLISRASTDSGADRKSRETAITALVSFFGKDALDGTGLEVSTERQKENKSEIAELIKVADTSTGTNYVFALPLVKGGSTHPLPLSIDRGEPSDPALPKLTEFKWEQVREKPQGNAYTGAEKSFLTDTLKEVSEKFSKDQRGNEITLVREANKYKVNEEASLKASTQNGAAITDATRASFNESKDTLTKSSDFVERQSYDKLIREDVDRAYQQLLGRKPDYPGANWALDLFNSGKSYRDALRGIASAAEFKNAIPQDKDKVMPFLYSKLLLRSFGSGDNKAMYEQLIAKEGIDGAINFILSSAEFNEMAASRGKNKAPELKDALPPETNEKCNAAARTIEDLQNQLRANPENKLLQDALIALGGLDKAGAPEQTGGPAKAGSGKANEERQKLIAASLEAINRVPDGLLSQLKAQDPAMRFRAMEKIDLALNSSNDSVLQQALSESRARMSTFALTEKSTPESYARAKENIQRDFEKALAAGDNVLANELKDRYNWTNAAGIISELNGIKTSDQQKAAIQTAAGVEALMDQASKGNPYAQAAVAMILNTGDAAAQKRSHDLLAQEKSLTLAVPDISKLPEQAQLLVRNQALAFLVQKTAMTNGTISKAEASALTDALLNAEKRKDNQAAKLLSSALDLALSSKKMSIPRPGQEPLIVDGKKAASEAINDAINRGADSETLVNKYLSLLASDKQADLLSKEDFNALVRNASEGKPAAMKVLATIATTDGELAKDAQAKMIELAAGEKTREIALLATLDAKDPLTLHRNGAAELFKQLLGKAELPPRVEQAILSKLNSTDDSEKAAGRNAMLASADRWMKGDSGENALLKAAASNMNAELIELLKDKKDLMQNPAFLNKLGLSIDTANGVTTLKHAASNTEYKIKDFNGKLRLFEQNTYGADQKLSHARNNLFDEKTGEFKGAEEIDSTGNKAIFNKDKLLTEVRRSSPEGEFVKISRTNDGKATAVFDNYGRGWDSKDGGRTWARRGSNEKAYGAPEFQAGGVIKFSGAGPEGKVETLDKPSGIVWKYDEARKESTVSYPDKSYETKNESGKTLKSRDANGNEREFFWSEDSKKLLGVKDETGLWQASPDGTHWQNLNAPDQPAQIGTRTVDTAGYHIRNSGASEKIFRRDGSVLEIKSEKEQSIHDRHANKLDLKFEGKELREVNENGNVWRRKEGALEDKSLYLIVDGKPTEIKAKFELSDDRSKLKRIIETATEAKDGAVKGFFKETEYRSDGTMLARDEQGRVRRSRNRDGELSNIEYLDKTNVVARIGTSFPDGHEEITALRNPSKPEEEYIKTFWQRKSPGSDELVREDVTKENWNISALSVDHATGSIKASEVTVISSNESGERRRRSHALVVSSLDNGSIAFQRHDAGLLISDRYNGNQTRSSYKWAAEGSLSSTSTIRGRDASCTYDAAGNLTRVEGLANNQSFEIKRGENGSIEIAESNGTRWQSADGKTFTNPATQQTFSGEFFASTDGKYGFKIPGSSESTIIRDVARRETIFSPPERFQIQRLVKDVTSVALTDNNAIIQRDANGRTLALVNPDGKIVRATRDASGNVQELSITDPRSNQAMTWKKDGARLLLTRGAETEDLGNSRLELSERGEIVQISDKNKIEYVRKTDGTEIRRLQGSSEFDGKQNFRYVVDRPDGSIAEYHYRVHAEGAAENLEVVKTGTRNIDSSLNAETVMRKMPNSNPQEPTWYYSDSAEIRSGAMKMGQTWKGSQNFDPTNGEFSTIGAKPGEKAARIRETADGWRQEAESPVLSKRGMGGEIVYKSSTGEVNKIADRNGRNIDIKHTDGQISELSITEKGGKEASEKFSSADGKTWSRKFRDAASGEWKEEKFSGHASVDSEGVIRIRKAGADFITLRPEGQRITHDKAAGITLVEKTNGERERVGFGPNNKVNRIYNSDNSYTATDDGVNWRSYDATGKLKTDSAKQQIVEFDEKTGTITTQAKDGSRVEMKGGDGSLRIYSAVGPKEQSLVLTYDKNARADVTEVRYEQGKKIETVVSYANKTVQKFNGDDLLSYMKDIRGKETSISWEGTPPRSTIKSFTDESGLKFERHSAGFYLAKNRHGFVVDRYDGTVFVNSEGKLERIFGTSSNIVGQDRGVTAANVREIRGLDGNVLNLVGNKGVTVRNSEGLLQRSIDGTGFVRQFEFGDKDRWGQPSLDKVIIGEGNGEYSISRQYWYWEDAAKSKMAPKWLRSDGKALYDHDSKAHQNWRVDHTTGDMFCYRNDFVTEHFNLESGKWTTGDESSVRAKADEIKTIADRYSIQYFFDPNGRYRELNDQLKDLSADQIQAVKDYLMSKALNINEYVNHKYSRGSVENTVLNGHLRRIGHTRDAHNVELAELALKQALAEKTQRGYRTNLEVEKDLRDKISPLNQRQIAMLNDGYAKEHDGKTVLEDMKVDPSWKRSSALHKEAMESYLTKGKGNRTVEEELKLAKMAAEYLPASFPKELQDKNLDSVREALIEQQNSRRGRKSIAAVDAYVDMLRQDRLALVQEFLGEGRVDDNVRQAFAENKELGKAYLENNLLLSSQRKADGNYEFKNGIFVSRNDAGRVMALAMDAVNLGKVSEATQMELGNWATGNSKADIDRIFHGMSDSDRKRIQLGMDIRMALDAPGKNEKHSDSQIAAGKVISEKLQSGALLPHNLTPRDKQELAHFRRAEAKKLLEDPEKGFQARAALASYDQLYKTAGRQSMWGDERNERFRKEYLQAAAGADFSHEMGEKNISMMWWNSSKDEHMKSVENMDERSFSLLTSNTNLRELMFSHMRKNFDYDRGIDARKLLEAKFQFVEDLMEGKEKLRLGTAFGEEQRARLKELLPGTRSMSDSAFQDLMSQRALSKDIEAGRKLREQIERGKQYESMMSFAEQLTKDIAEGKRIEKQLNSRDTDILALYRRSKKTEPELTAAEKQAEAFARADLQKFRDSISNQQGESKLSETEKKSIAAFDKFQSLLKIEEKVKDGLRIQKNIEEGRLLAGSLEKNASSFKDKLTDEQKAQIDLFERSTGKAPGLSAGEKENLALSRAWQQKQADPLLASFKRGNEITDTLAQKNPESRAEYRKALSPEDRAALSLYQDMKAAKELNKEIEAGRKLSHSILDGSLENATPNTEQTRQLQVYRAYMSGKLPEADKLALEKLQAIDKAGDAKPGDTALSKESADALEKNLAGMQQLHSLQQYNEDKSGLKLYLDGLDVARQLNGMLVAKQVEAMKALETDPARAHEKAALEYFRKTTFEIARDNIRRDISEVISDVDHTFSKDYKALFDAVVGMKPDERKRYAGDEDYRKQIDDAASNLLKSYPDALAATKHLLLQIKDDPTKAPQKDLVFDLLAKAQDGKRSAAEAAFAIQEAFNVPAGKELKRKLDANSPDYDERYAKAFDAAWKRHLPLSAHRPDAPARDRGPITSFNDFKTRVLDDLNANGHLKISTIRDLRGGAVISPEELGKQILTLNERSRENFASTEKEKLGSVFYGEQKEFIEKILATRGELGIEDKLKAIHVGILPKEDLIKTINEIKTMDERRQVANNYATKYNADLISQMKSVAASADQGRIEIALRFRDMTALEQLYKAQDHSNRVTRTGWDTQGWNSTKYQLDNRMGELTKLIGGDNANFRETEQSKIDESLDAVWEAQRGISETQKEMANVAREIMIAAAATVLTIASGGTMSWAAIALFTLAAAAGSAALTKLAMGDNVTTDDMKEAAKDGAKSAFIQSLGPGHLQKLTGFGATAAKTAANQLLKEAAFKGLSEAEKKIVQQEIEKTVVKMLRQGAQSASMKGIDQQINHAVMELLQKSPITGKIMEGLGQEGAQLLGKTFEKSAHEAIMKLGSRYVENEMQSTLQRVWNAAAREGYSATLSHGAATASSLVVETADMMWHGKITVGNILDGSAFSDKEISSQYAKSIFHANLAAGAGHWAGRASHHLVNPESIANRLALTQKLDPTTMRMMSSGFLSERSARLIGNVTHFTASGAFMVGGMSGSNLIAGGVENLLYGKVVSPTENMSSLIQYSIAPFITGVHGTYAAAGRANIGRASYNLNHEATVKPSAEPIRGSQAGETKIVKYQSPTLENARFERPVVIEDGKGSISSGTVELRTTHDASNATSEPAAKLLADVPAGQTLKIVVSDPAALKNLEIASSSKGKVELYIAQDHSGLRDLLSEHVHRIAEGQVELKTLGLNGESKAIISQEMARSLIAQVESVDGLSPLWRPERHLNGSELAALSAQLGDNAGKLSDAAVAQKYLEQVGRTISDAREPLRQTAEEFKAVRDNFETTKASLEAELAKEGLRLPQEKDFDASSLHEWSRKDASGKRNEIVSKFLAERETHAEALKALNQKIDTSLKTIEDAINKFNSREGIPPVSLKRYGDLHVADASYRDGVIKVKTEDLINNPGKLLINTYHESAHVAQDAEALKSIQHTLAAAQKFGVKPEEVTAEQKLKVSADELSKVSAERVAERYAELSKHSHDKSFEKQWMSFVAKSLELPALGKEQLSRADNLIKSFAEIGAYKGQSEHEIRQDYNAIKSAKQHINSESGVGAQELLLLMKKAAAGDATAMQLARRIFGSDAEHLVAGKKEAAVAPTDAARADAQKERFDAIRDLYELASNLDPNNPSPITEAKAKALFEKLMENRVAQLNEQLMDAYNQYMRMHEADALAAENYLRRVAGDGLERLNMSAAIELPTDALGDVHSSAGQMPSIKNNNPTAATLNNLRPVENLLAPVDRLITEKATHSNREPLKKVMRDLLRHVPAEQLESYANKFAEAAKVEGFITRLAHIKEITDKFQQGKADIAAVPLDLLLDKNISLQTLAAFKNSLKPGGISEAAREAFVDPILRANKPQEVADRVSTAAKYDLAVAQKKLFAFQFGEIAALDPTCRKHIVDSLIERQLNSSTNMEGFRRAVDDAVETAKIYKSLFEIKALDPKVLSTPGRDGLDHLVKDLGQKLLEGEIDKTTFSKAVTERLNLISSFLQSTKNGANLLAEARSRNPQLTNAIFEPLMKSPLSEKALQNAIETVSKYEKLKNTEPTLASALLAIKPSVRAQLIDPFVGSTHHKNYVVELQRTISESNDGGIALATAFKNLFKQSPKVAEELHNDLRAERITGEQFSLLAQCPEETRTALQSLFKKHLAANLAGEENLFRLITAVHAIKDSTPTKQAKAIESFAREMAVQSESPSKQSWEKIAELAASDSPNRDMLVKSMILNKRDLIQWLNSLEYSKLGSIKGPELISRLLDCGSSPELKNLGAGQQSRFTNKLSNILAETGLPTEAGLREAQIEKYAALFRALPTQDIAQANYGLAKLLDKMNANDFARASDSTVADLMRLFENKAENMLEEDRGATIKKLIDSLQTTQEGKKHELIAATVAKLTTEADIREMQAETRAQFRQAAIEYLDKLESKSRADNEARTAQRIEVLIDKLFPAAIDRSTADRIFGGLTESQRKILLEHREEFLSQSGMRKVFDQVAVEIEKAIRIGQADGWAGFTHKKMVQRITAVATTEEGRALAYEFRKSTGIEVVLKTPQQLEPGEKAVLFENNLKMKQEDRTILARNKQVLQPSKIQEFGQGLNMFDMAVSKSNPSHLQERIRTILALPDLAFSTSGKISDAEFAAINRPVEDAREIGMTRALAHFSKQSDAARELSYAVNEMNIVSNTDFAQAMRSVHKQLFGQAHNPGSELAQGIIFVDLSRNKAGSSGTADSSHLAMHMYRLANGLSDSKYDSHFVSKEQAKAIIARAGSTQSLKVIAINDCIGSGGETSTIVGDLASMRAQNSKVEIKIGLAIASKEGTSKVTIGKPSEGEKGRTITENDKIQIVSGIPPLSDFLTNVQRALPAGGNKFVASLQDMAYKKGAVEPTGFSFEYMFPNTTSRRMAEVLDAVGIRGAASATRIQTFPDTVGPPFSQKESIKGLSNFAKVDEKVFRGGQVRDEAGMQALKDSGVKIIIDMTQQGIDIERQLAEQYGMEYRHMPVDSNANDPKQIKEVLRAIEGASGKVFVHCAHGKDRTGAVIGLYRQLHNEGWSAEHALHEMHNFGWRGEKPANVRFGEFLSRPQDFDIRQSNAGSSGGEMHSWNSSERASSPELSEFLQRNAMAKDLTAKGCNCSQALSQAQIELEKRSFSDLRAKQALHAIQYLQQATTERPRVEYLSRLILAQAMYPERDLQLANAIKLDAKALQQQFRELVRSEYQTLPQTNNQNEWSDSRISAISKRSKILSLLGGSEDPNLRSSYLKVRAEQDADLRAAFREKEKLERKLDTEELSEAEDNLRRKLGPVVRQELKRAAAELEDSAPNLDTTVPINLRSGGDLTQGLIFKKLQEVLEKRPRAFQEQYVLIPQLAKTAIDDIGGDFILLDKRTGKYIPVDASQKDKSDIGLPAIRSENVISAPPIKWQGNLNEMYNPSFPAEHLREPLREYRRRNSDKWDNSDDWQKRDILRTLHIQVQFERILDGQQRNGASLENSPLNIIDMPPPNQSRPGLEAQQSHKDRFAELMSKPGHEKIQKIKEFLHDLNQTNRELATYLLQGEDTFANLSRQLKEKSANTGNEEQAEANAQLESQRKLLRTFLDHTHRNAQEHLESFSKKLHTELLNELQKIKDPATRMKELDTFLKGPDGIAQKRKEQEDYLTNLSQLASSTSMIDRDSAAMIRQFATTRYRIADIEKQLNISIKAAGGNTEMRSWSSNEQASAPELSEFLQRNAIPSRAEAPPLPTNGTPVIKPDSQGWLYKDEHGKAQYLSDDKTPVHVTENVTLYAIAGKATQFFDSSRGFLRGKETEAQAHGTSEVDVREGASITADGDARVHLHDNGRAVLSDRSEAVIRNTSSASVTPGLFKSPTVHAYDDSKVFVANPSSLFIKSTPAKVTLNDNASAIVSGPAAVTANGTKTFVKVNSEGHGSQLKLNGATAKVENATVIINGDGVVRVSGDKSRLVIDAGDKALKIIVEAGSPQIEIRNGKNIEIQTVESSKPVISNTTENTFQQRIITTDGKDLGKVSEIPAEGKLLSDRSGRPKIAVNAASTMKQVIDTIRKVDPALAEELLAEPMMIVPDMGNAAKGIVRIVSADGSDGGKVKSMRELIASDGANYPQLDLANAQHELAGHRAFDRFMDKAVEHNPVEKAQLEKIRTDLHRTNNQMLANPNPETHARYLNSPPELAADYIAAATTVAKMKEQISELQKSKQPIPADLTETYEKMLEYKQALDKSIHKVQRDNPSTKFFFEKAREFSNILTASWK